MNFYFRALKISSRDYIISRREKCGLEVKINQIIFPFPTRFVIIKLIYSNRLLKQNIY
jgi:hypothetical protein